MISDFCLLREVDVFFAVESKFAGIEDLRANNASLLLLLLANALRDSEEGDSGKAKFWEMTSVFIADVAWDVVSSEKDKTINTMKTIKRTKRRIRCRRAEETRSKTRFFDSAHTMIND